MSTPRSSDPHRTRRTVGKVIGIAGLACFVLVVIAMAVLLLTGSATGDDGLAGAGIGLFAAAIGAFIVGVVGMVIAGAGSGDQDVDSLRD